MERKNRKEITGNGETVTEGETSKINAEDFIEKGTESENAGGAKIERKRNYSRKNKDKDKDALNLSESIYAVHEFLSFLFQTDEISITKEQSLSLASAIDNLDLEIQSKISKKTIAIIQLAVVASTIYIPKVILIKDKIKNKKNKNEIS